MHVTPSSRSVLGNDSCHWANWECNLLWANINLLANLFLVFHQLSAELKQGNAKLHQAEGSIQGHLSEWEHQQQRIRELEVELADSSTKQSVISSLQGELQTERAKLAAANKKVAANSANSGSLGTCCLLIISSSTAVLIITWNI